MFEPSTSPRVFALPPGVDFPRLLVAGIARRMAGQPPEAMARVTVYLNTARMLRRVRAMFDDHCPGFLPRLRLVTDIGRDPLAGMPPPVPPIRRRLELAQLVAGLAASRTDFAAGTAVFDLADSLAQLMDEMQGEGVPVSALAAPQLADNHAGHWERSLSFIRIVGRYFDGSEAPDPEARQRLLVAALRDTWRDRPPGTPVIVAGSTGSRGTTSMFMQAVARLPQGAVILPGFDFDMPDLAWNSLGSGPIPPEDHPQYRFWRFTRAMDMAPQDVRHWSDVASPDPARSRLISLALRPVPVTDQWLVEGKTLGAMTPATKAVTVINAPTPRAEAMAIALCLRHAAECGTKAALVSPDRMLTRRVAAALDRWDITADDSAGQPLGQTAPGRFLRHIAEFQGRNVTAGALLTLLKHPLTATGAGDRGNHLRFTRDLELKLRRFGPAFPQAGDVQAWAGAKGDADLVAWANWLATALTLSTGVAARPLAACVAWHMALAEALAAGPSGSAEGSALWREAAGRAAFAAMDELRREAGHGGAFSPPEYSRLITSVLAKGEVRPIVETHPLISIWGTLESRVQGADLVILAGLNEGVWPAMPAPDPWLSRQMRMQVGLLLPERRIGLSAHDFQQAANAPQVVLSRSIRDAEAETVPSRWLARLANLLNGLPDQGGKAAYDDMCARGAVWLRLGAALETPTAAMKIGDPPALRPAPRPPVAARPAMLAVTGIRTLIRDPYAIYARAILGLKPLDPLRAAPDARLRGQVLHRIAEGFIRDRPGDETAGAARDRLLSLAETVLTGEIPWPSAQRIWLAKFARIADRFVGQESRRATSGIPVILEETGSVTLENGFFTLTARPDRIDLLSDGRVHVYDYKSGTPPSDKQQKTFDKQLLLEAAMAERGGFAPLGPREVKAVTYIRLGGDGQEKTTPIEGDMLLQTWAQLHQLIDAYHRRETGYASRRAVFEARRGEDYDHLARFGEWQMSDAPVPEDVG